MGSKSFDQFYQGLLAESQQRTITVQEALAMAHRAGFEYGFERGKAEDPGDEATPQDNAASRLLRSMPDDSRLP
jgi:hypothetical protein